MSREEKEWENIPFEYRREEYCDVDFCCCCSAVNRVGSRQYIPSPGSSPASGGNYSLTDNFVQSSVHRGNLCAKLFGVEKWLTDVRWRVEFELGRSEGGEIWNCQLYSYQGFAAAICQATTHTERLSSG